MSITRADLDKLKRILHGAVISHLDRQDAKVILDKIEADLPKPGPSVGPNGKVVIRDDAGRIVGSQG
jgi:hypothetical protein